MNICELYRKEAVNKLFTTNTVKSCWPSWKTKIAQISNGNLDAPTILNLGDSLSSIFQVTNAGRSQGGVSGAGSAWESLVCWYLNLALTGSRTVVFKQCKALSPEPIRNAIQVNYGTFPSNTEADLIAITFPDEFWSTKNLIALESDINASALIHKKRNGDYDLKKTLDSFTEKYFQRIEVTIIQCKTNWNDNAQIPMLWGMIYSAQGFLQNSGIAIGTNNYSAHNLKQFKYAFVTVPTNTNVVYKSTATCVHRVRNLSGGNYWGKATEASVAFSIKEIFSRNFASGSSIHGLRADLTDIINNSGIPSYFRL